MECLDARGGPLPRAMRWRSARNVDRQLAAREQPETRLLPEAPKPQHLTAGGPSEAEAQSIIAKVADRAGMKQKREPVVYVGKRMTDQEWTDRIALLKRQAEEVATPVAEEV